MEIRYNKKALLLGILFIFLIFLVLYIYPRDCGNDLDCFNERASNCDRVKVVADYGNNEYLFNIKGSEGEMCIASVYFNKAGDNTPINVAEYLKGKGMVCEIPRESLKQKSINLIGDLNNYCTGPLKEATLEITVKTLQDDILSNIDNVAAGFKRTLEQG